MEVFVKNFDKVMNGFEIYQIVVINVNANTEIESRISAVNYLKVPELLPSKSQLRAKINQ